MNKKIIEYMKLVRLPGWGGYCMPAIFGTLTVGVLDPGVLFSLFIIGIFVTIYGFVLNDYIDTSVDTQSIEISERPLVKGSISRLSAIKLTLFSIVIAYVLIGLFMYYSVFIFRLSTIVVFTFAVIFAAIYNVYSKKYLGIDIFLASAISLYCLFGAMAVSRIITNLTWIVIAVTFLQVFFLNVIIGGLKDAEHDFKFGVRNIALFLGVRVKESIVSIPLLFKILALSIRLLSMILLFFPFFLIKDFPYMLWQPVIMICMFIGVFALTIRLLTLKQFKREEIRKLISMQVFLRYSIVPVMLISVTGYFIGFILIFYPFLWYVAFNRFLYGSMIQPRTL